MAVIAMTREMATLGKDVAQGVADRLGLEIVHHELVEHDIAERSGLRESEVHRYLEGEATLYERWRIDRKRLSRFTSEEILELAARGNVLIRGWGATHLLRDVPHVVCVRVCAPLKFRTRTLMRRLKMADVDTARREIMRNDAAHNGTLQRLFGIGFEDPTHYALVLNTSRVPVEECVEAIVRLASSPRFAETDEARGVLADQLVLAKVNALIDDAGGHGRSGFSGIAAEVASGKVVLQGASVDESTVADLIRQVHGIQGVKAVESRIRHIDFRAHA